MSSEGLMTSVETLHSPDHLCECANSAASTPTAMVSSKSQQEEKMWIDEKSENNPPADQADMLPELVRMDFIEGKPVLACYLGQQQGTLSQLRTSGLVRRHAERLERLSGSAHGILHSLKPLHLCQRSKKSYYHMEEEMEFSGFTGEFIQSSTPCQVQIEPLGMPLANEALLRLVTPISAPHGSKLTRSSSTESVRSVRGKPGLVRQRAQQIETHMRLAGLTVPSRLKRSNSLAKLDSLDFSSEDLWSACSSDAGTLLLLSLSPDPDTGPERDSPNTTPLPQPCKDVCSTESTFRWAQKLTHHLELSYQLQPCVTCSFSRGFSKNPWKGRDLRKKLLKVNNANWCCEDKPLLLCHNCCSQLNKSYCCFRQVCKPSVHL